MSQDRTRIIAGCMTGTSLDGLDVALVKIIGTGLNMQAELLGHHALPMPDDLRTTLMSLASGEANEPITYMRAARALGEFHADGIERLADGLGPPTPKIDFITAHGQTIWHAPRDGNNELGGGPKSWQLFDPWPIVKRLNVPVCYDLRQADLIAGGEGAPLTPIADWVMYRGDIKRLIVNLGGVCNATILPARNLDLELTAFDLGPCNLLIDGLVQRLFPTYRFDRDGVLSNQGGLWDDFGNEVMKAPFFARPWPRTAGREDFDGAWVDHLIDFGRSGMAHGKMSDADMLASAINAVADHVVTGFVRRTSGDAEIILAGGGARNPNLFEEICMQCEVLSSSVTLSDDLGIPCEAREAMGFAVLGALSQDGIPISLPQVTGATDPGVAGVWAGV